MLRDFARDTIGLHRSSDSAMEQLVFAFENASVAAAKRDISVENDKGVLACPSGPSTLEVVEGISLGSCVEVLEAVTSCCPGFDNDGGFHCGVGFCEDVIGAGSPSDWLALPDAFMKFSNPFRFGTRKLYAMGYGVGGGCPRM